MNSVKMTDFSVNELEEYLKHNQTIIIPYALAEQHGHHLPLDTDIRNADFASAALARKIGCITAPTLNYCFSGGMLKGTINIKPNTFSNLVSEVIESLYLQGFRNFIIIPGHGGSESMFHLKESLRINRWINPAMRDALIMMTPIWDFSPTWTELFKNNDFHAALAETSLMLHWCPEVVRPRIVLDEPAVAERLRQDPDSYQLIETFTAFGHEIPQTSQRADVKIGVMGYPEKATAKLGAQIEAEFIANAAKELTEAIASAEAMRKSGERLSAGSGNKLKILSL